MTEIDDILAKHFSEQVLSLEEEAVLLKWKAENTSEYIAIEKTIKSSEDYRSVEFNATNGWDKMSKRIADDKKRTFTLKPILKYAVAASIAILIGFTGFQFFTKNTAEFIVFENNESIHKVIELPDGSVVDLGTNSRLEYATNFEDQRQLKLDGKAFFNVIRNESKPFIIATNQGLVTVLGTSFAVNTFDNKTQVDVKTGLVALSAHGKEIRLAKGESAWANDKHISNKTAVNPNFIAWKTGEFSFNDTPITAVIMFLESFFGDVIDYQETSKECAFTGSFDNQNIEDIIEALVLSCNLEFSSENNRFTLK